MKDDEYKRIGKKESPHTSHSPTLVILSNFLHFCHIASIVLFKSKYTYPLVAEPGI